jgi:hypothetical protein
MPAPGTAIGLALAAHFHEAASLANGRTAHAVVCFMGLISSRAVTALAKIVVSSTPRNVEGKAQVRAASGKGYDQFAI